MLVVGVLLLLDMRLIAVLLVRRALILFDALDVVSLNQSFASFELIVYYLTLGLIDVVKVVDQSIVRKYIALKVDGH